MLRHVPAALVSIGLGVLLTWPLALHLSTHVPGTGAGDNMTFLWNFWWVREALVSPARDVFYTTALFAPEGTSLVLHTHTALEAFVGATLLSGLSIVAAQNVVLIGSTALNAFATYLLGWFVTKRRGPALLSGALFAATPYFAAHLHGHFNLVPAWVLPLGILAWLRAVDRPSLPRSIAAGLAFVATAYSDYYYLVYLTAFVGLSSCVRWFALSGRIRSGRSDGLLDGLLLSGVGLAGTMAAVIALTGGGVLSVGSLRISATSGTNLRSAAWVFGLVWAWRRWRPAVQLTRREDSTSFRADARVLAPVAVTLLLGASPLVAGAVRLWLNGDYVSQAYAWRSAPAGVDLSGLVMGSPFHAISGPLILRIYQALGIDPIERSACVGLVPLIALAATWRSWWGRPDARLWIASGAIFFVWALGPQLTLFGQQTGLLLPATLLRFVPIVANARIPGRALVMVALALVMLLAVAFSARRTSRGRLLALGVVGLIELLPLPIPLVVLDTPLVYRELATMPDGVLLDIPFGMRDGFGELGRLDHRTLFYQTVHQKPLVGGFVARLSPSVRDRVLDAPLPHALLTLSSGGAIDADTLARSLAGAREWLHDTGVRYVVVDTETASVPLQELTRALPLRLIRQEETRALYEVD